MVPGGGFAGICGVVSGKAAPLVGGPPGVELHIVTEEVPSGVVEMFPIVVVTIGAGMVPSTAAGVNAPGDIVGVDDVIAAVAPDMETGPGIVDGAGTGAGAMEGDGRGGGAGGGGAGMVEPG
jgi:hypothetical protein